MAFDIDNPYLRHKVMTATQEELRLMLLEGGLHFIDQGLQGLDKGDYEAVYEGFSQAKAIVMELMNGLRHEIAPELCGRLQSLYTYMYKLLIDASFERSREKAIECRELLDYERETWGLLMEKAKAEGVSGPIVPDPSTLPEGTAPPAPQVRTGTYASAPSPAASGQRPGSLSIEG